MPITTRSAAKKDNTEESNRGGMADNEEQELPSSANTNDNLIELFEMMRQQTELILEHKVAQTKQMNEIQRLIGDIDEKIERISKRQDRLETRLDQVDVDLSYVSGELEKFVSQRNTVPVNVECFEARLNVVENCTDGLGERLETIQKELVPRLKESILEELLVQINLKETKKQKSEMSYRDGEKSAQERVQNTRTLKAETPIFPSPERRFTPSTVKHERGSRFTPTRVGMADTGAPIKLLQKPTTFDGSTLWESYYAQFEIVARINDWDDCQKAAYLATSLKGPALAVLGNLAPEDRQNLDVLLVALKNRFGSSHQTELSRVKFKNRIKQKDESFPQMAEDIERLCRLAYPDAPPTLRDVLARDQFIDALPDEDTRLRIKQERPKTLRKALEAALELESFQIAARQRVKVSRETELLRSKLDTDQKESEKFSQLEEGKLEMMKILERLEKSMKLCLDSVLAAAKAQRRSPKAPGCWNCGDLNHIRRNCPNPHDDGNVSENQGNGN